MRYGLTPEENTLNAMVSLRHLMDNLARERVYEELSKLLPLVSAEDLTRFGPILAAVIPELEVCIGFQQHNPHHTHDVYGHTAQVVAAVPADLTLRWATLLHDVGKPVTFTLDDQGIGHFYGHAKESAALADTILRRMKAPTALRERVVTLVAQHMTPLTADRKLLRRRLSSLGAETLHQLLALQEADQGGTEENLSFLEVRRILAELEAENACLSLKDLAVNGHDLMELGITGPRIGTTLHALLAQVLDEQLPNEKQALLQAAQEVNP